MRRTTAKIALATLVVAATAAAVSRRTGEAFVAVDHTRRVAGMIERVRRIGDVEVVVRYCSPEAMARRERRYGGDGAAVEWRDLVEEYEESVNFVLEIRPLGAPYDVNPNVVRRLAARNGIPYRDAIEYLAFHMNEDLRLVSGNETVSPALYHFERGFEANPILRFLVAFPLAEAGRTNVTFVFDDRFFGAGHLALNFDLSQANGKRRPRGWE